MSRVRAPEPYVQQKVSLPATLMARFTQLHFDPVLRKTKYAAISKVLTALLTDYVNKMERSPQLLEEHNKSLEESLAPPPPTLKAL